MRFFRPLLVAVPLLATALAPARDAAASGGYFPAPSAPGTAVKEHRMIVAFGQDKTTLWDQMRYEGSPESFAWVLPIKGQVEVRISSDGLFENLDVATEVKIRPLEQSCPPPSSCSPAPSLSPSAPRSVDMGTVAEQAVGPYETAQISSQDPGALGDWLAQRGYAIPAEVSPVLGAYMAEGYDFLALKLAPEQGVQAMKPVRVTAPGKNLVLPLRMAAAGAGPTVPITLWIFGAETYRPSNFPTFTVPADKVVWDWDKRESNYESLRQDGFAATSNKGWQIEVAGSFPADRLVRDPLCDVLARLSPGLSGYDTDMSRDAAALCFEDFLPIVQSGLQMTRLHAELPREALAADLTLEAGAPEGAAPIVLDVTETTGDAPDCPSADACPASDTSGCACAAAADKGASRAPLGALLALGLAVLRRRKRAAPPPRS